METLRAACTLPSEDMNGRSEALFTTATKHSFPVVYLTLRQPPSASGSVPTATKSGLKATTEDHLKRDEKEESLSSLASPKSVCGGHPYHE